MWRTVDYKRKIPMESKEIKDVHLEVIIRNIKFNIWIAIVDPYIWRESHRLPA